MTWIALRESGVNFNFSAVSPLCIISGDSRLITQYNDRDWSADFSLDLYKPNGATSNSLRLRFTPLLFESNAINSDEVCPFSLGNASSVYDSVSIADSSGPYTEWLPSPFELGPFDYDNSHLKLSRTGSLAEVRETSIFLMEVWVGDGPPDPPDPPAHGDAVPSTKPALVNEFEKGWSFDGNYIPHFVELNWYFGDNPVDFRELSNVRIHGLSKGNVQLSVSTNGMETDADFYAEDYSEPQHIDLPRKQDWYVSSEYRPVTNYEQPLNRGISVQMKFEGRNESIDRPEPSHVIQVLVTQSSPIGNGNRSN